MLKEMMNKMGRKSKLGDCQSLKFRVHTPSKKMHGEPKVILERDYFYFNKAYMQKYMQNKNKVFIHVAETEEGIIIAFEKTSDETNNKAIDVKKGKNRSRVKEHASNIIKVREDLDPGCYKFCINMVKIPFANEVPSIHILKEWVVDDEHFD